MSSEDESEVIESSLEVPEYETQFIPQEDDDETLWEVIEILAERGNRYKVLWDGIDPATGKPWAPSWVAKHDCTDKLIQEWKVKQAKKKKAAQKKKAASTTSSKVSKQTSPTPGPSVSRRTRSSSSAQTSRPSTSVPPSGDPLSTHTSKPRSSHAKETTKVSTRKRKTRDSDHDVEEDQGPHRSAPKGKRRRLEVEIVVPPRERKRVESRERIQDSETDNGSEVLEVQPKRSTIARDRKGNHIPSKPPHDTDEDIPELHHHVITKIGPPRGVKKRRHASGSLPEPAVAHSKPPKEQPTRKSEPKPRTPSLSPVLDSHDVVHDTFSREGFVPETQGSPHIDLPSRHASPSGQSQESADHPPTTPPRPRPGDTPQPSSRPPSIISKMRRRPRRNTADKFSFAPPSPMSRRFTLELPSSFESPFATHSDDELPVPKQDTRPMHRVPVLSPSTFYPHLRDEDPPPSSIEQFSSPEKEGRHAGLSFGRKAERLLKGKKKSAPLAAGRNKISQSSEIDTTSQITSNRSKDRRLDTEEELAGSRFFEELPGSENVGHMSPDTESRDAPFESILLVDSPKNTVEEQEEQDELIAEGMMDEFVNLEGEESMYADGEGQSYLEDMHGQKQSSPRPVSPGTLESVRLQQNTAKSLPPTSIMELPLTSSTQRADADSQSQAYDSQIKDLHSALAEKLTLLEQLEIRNKALEDEVSTLRNDIETSRTTHALLTSKCDSLELELQEAEVRNRQLEEQAVESQRVFSEEKAGLTKSLEQAQLEAQQQQRRKEDAEKDRDLFKDLYTQASAYASETAGESKELQSRVDIAEGQARDGIKLLKATYTRRLELLQEDVDKWKALCKVLTTKDERTNDEIRRRAAVEPILREENEQLKSDLDACRADFERIKQQLAASESEDEVTREPSQDAGADTGGDTLNINGISQPIDPQLSTGNGPYPGEVSDVANYVCQHVNGMTMCNAKFSTPKEVQDHAFLAHYPDLQELVNLNV